MDTRKEEAIKRHKKGYNCAQAVACTYCDLVGVDEDTMFRATEGLGGGMGNMDGTCGAVTATGVLAGFLNSTGQLERPDSKAATGKLTRAMVEKFKEQNQSIICRELKGRDTGKIIRTCPGCIMDACMIAEEVLFHK